MQIMNCIRNSYNLTNKYIILATPLILFSLLSSLYLLFSMHGSFLSMAIAVVLFSLMFAAFISGWCFMIKSVIAEPEYNVDALIKEFPAGVGEYFLSAIGAVFNIIIFSFALLALSYWVGMIIIGDIGISVDANTNIMANAESINIFLQSLTNEQLIKLKEWFLLWFSAMGIVSFILMYYLPVFFYKEKNPFMAFIICCKDLLSRKFLSNLGLYVLILGSYMFISLLETFQASNVLMHFLYTLLDFYYMVFVAVLIFNFYYNNYIKVGGEVDKLV